MVMDADNSNRTVQLVNATALPLIVGTAGPGPSCNRYQMRSWPSPDFSCPAKSDKTFEVWFARGVGDQDDGADLQLNIGIDPWWNPAMWIQARSASNSGHYLQVSFQPPSEGALYIHGICLSSTWQDAQPSTIEWGVALAGGTVFLKYLGTMNEKQAIIYADLTEISPDAVTASYYYTSILSKTLSPAQQSGLYVNVNTYIAHSER
jgi:hypothetical protein